MIVDLCIKGNFKCYLCHKLYIITIIDKKQAASYKVVCECGGNCKEVNEYFN